MHMVSCGKLIVKTLSGHTDKNPQTQNLTSIAKTYPLLNKLRRLRTYHHQTVSGDGGGRRFVEFNLAFVGQALQQEDRAEGCYSQHGGHGVDAGGRQAGDYQGYAAQHCGCYVHHQDGASVAQAQVREAVRGVVFARRSKRQQAAASARDGDQRGVKDGDTPRIRTGTSHVCGNCVPSGRIFSPSVAIRNPRNIAPPSPMKIFAGLKFQRRKPSDAPSAAAPRVRTSVCPFIAAEIVKKPAAMAAIPAQSPSM